jgi:hypothetical protein
MLFIYFRQWIRNYLEKPGSIVNLEIPLVMSLIAYPIELKHIKTSQEVGNELLRYR